MFKNILQCLVSILIVCAGYYVGTGAKNVYDFYKEVQNQEEQLEELYDNQAFILSLIDNNNTSIDSVFQDIRLKLINLNQENIELVNFLEHQNKKIVEQSNEINSQNIKIVDIAINLAETKRESIIKETLNNLERKRTNVRPSYDYLESVTVYILNRHSEEKRFIGTGVIVKQDFDFTYIMTNKHVCNKTDVASCNIKIYKHDHYVEIPLIFVKQTESKYDLSLWKTAEYLPYKRAIKGLSNIKKQDRVYSVGNYLGFKYIYTEGTFAGYSDEDEFIFNLPCSKGCSGSGVYNKDGNLVSIVFAVHFVNLFQTETAKIIGVPSEIVRLFLRNLI